MSEIAFCMDQGPRENLEDTCTAIKVTNALDHCQEAIVAMVLDGVGGADYGEVASRLARQSLTADLTALASLCISREGTRLNAPDEILGELSNALTRCNDVILQEGAANPRLKGMATTAVCALILRGILYVAWVGDSRCYLHREYENQQITRDHSEAEELVQLGVITPEEAREHPSSHTITRYLGQAGGFQPDSRACRIMPKDVVLLASDGLTDVVTDEEIAMHIEACQVGFLDLDELPQKLVQRALAWGTQDNVTVLCCEYEPPHLHTELNRTLTEAYSVELAKTMQQLTQEVNHA